MRREKGLPTSLVCIYKEIKRESGGEKERERGRERERAGERKRERESELERERERERERGFLALCRFSYSI